MPKPCKIISASKAQAYAKVHFVEGALSQVMLSIPHGRGVCMCGTYHFMVNLTADMVYFVGGKTHTIHNIPSGTAVSRVCTWSRSQCIDSAEGAWLGEVLYWHIHSLHMQTHTRM